MTEDDLMRRDLLNEILGEDMFNDEDDEDEDDEEDEDEEDETDEPLEALIEGLITLPKLAGLTSRLTRKP